MTATAMRTHNCGALRANHIGQEVRIAGWIHRRRDLGGIVFYDVRDREGLVQVAFGPDWSPAEVIELASGGDRRMRRPYRWTGSSQARRCPQSRRTYRRR